MTSSQPLSSEPIDVNVVDISSFTRRRKYLLFLPTLLQIAFALTVSYGLIVFARVVSAVILAAVFGFNPALLLIALVIPLASILPALIAISGYRALAHSSIWSFFVTTVLILLCVAFFSVIDERRVDFVDAITIASVIAGAYLVQTTIARVVFSDPGGWILWRGPPSARIVAALHRYGALNRSRIASSMLRLSLRLSGPALVALFICCAQFIFGRAASIDGFGFLLALLSLLTVIFIARPFFTNQLWRAIRLFKQENAETAAAVYEFDKRPRILLLRSFYDDTVELPYARSWGQAVLGLKLSRVRLEEAIVEVAYRYGPVGALQDPNSHLKPLGAARDLATSQDWQTRIQNALLDASVVIMVLGLTPGLRWELHTIRELGVLNKTIFIFPPADRADVSVIREIVRELLPTVHAVWSEKYSKPLLLFSDENQNWHLAISDKQAEQDYQYALLLAIEFGSHSAMPARRRKLEHFGQQPQAGGLSGLFSMLPAAVAAIVRVGPKSTAQSSTVGPAGKLPSSQVNGQETLPRPLLYPAPEKSDEMRWLPWVGTAIGGILFSYLIFNQSPALDPPPLEVQNPERDTKTSLGEVRPPIGVDQVFSPAQFRYCLAEQIRLEAARNFIDARKGSQIDRYNEMVDDYNGRCDGYPSDLSALKSVKEDVERHRLELETEGRGRF
jgi:hypothetical protein